VGVVLVVLTAPAASQARQIRWLPADDDASFYFLYLGDAPDFVERGRYRSVLLLGSWSVDAKGIAVAAASLADADAPTWAALRAVKGRRLSPFSNVVDLSPDASRSFDLVYRRNVGGVPFMDEFGDIWDSAAWFRTTRKHRPHAASLPDAPAVYETWLESKPGASVDFSFPVEPGRYRMRLHFAELSPAVLRAGQRIFGVMLEGRWTDTVDVVGEAGWGTPLVAEHAVEVRDGSLDLRLWPLAGAPILAGVEVLRGTSFCGALGQPDADADGLADACECGDMTGDGFVDELDLELVERCLDGEQRLCIHRCDVTADGACSDLDAEVIARFASGQLGKADLRCSPMR
jgi:hypothetical protein